MQSHQYRSITTFNDQNQNSLLGLDSAVCRIRLWTVPYRYKVLKSYFCQIESFSYYFLYFLMKSFCFATSFYWIDFILVSELSSRLSSMFESFIRIQRTLCHHPTMPLCQQFVYFANIFTFSPYLVISTRRSYSPRNSVPDDHKKFAYRLVGCWDLENQQRHCGIICTKSFVRVPPMPCHVIAFSHTNKFDFFR